MFRKAAPKYIDDNGIEWYAVNMRDSFFTTVIIIGALFDFILISLANADDRLPLYEGLKCLGAMLTATLIIMFISDVLLNLRAPSRIGFQDSWIIIVRSPFANVYRHSSYPLHAIETMSIGFGVRRGLERWIRGRSSYRGTTLLPIEIRIVGGNGP